MTTSQGGDTAARRSDGEADAAIELERMTVRLRELDHRVKNDLQLIASVLVLQLRGLPEGPERTAIRSALERVNSVAAVHRRLDVSGDPAHFEVSGMIRDLCEEITAGARRDEVRLTLDLWPTVVPSRQAAPLALITGELVRNALRHAFPERPGEIEVSLRPEAGMLCLSVQDDGIGLASADEAKRGFGAKLVALLAQQLRGTFELADAEPGVRAAVRFPEAG